MRKILQLSNNAKRFILSLVKNRWENEVYCVYCGSKEVIKWGKYKGLQRYKCKKCNKTFNDKTGTIFHYSHISLFDWGMIFIFYTYLHISSRKISKLLNISELTMWKITQKIRKTIKNKDKEEKLKGEIEIDEVYLCNGLKGNSKKVKLNRKPRKRGKRYKRGRGNYPDDKIPVIGIYNRETRKILLISENYFTKECVEKILRDNIHHDSRIFTDNHSIYRFIPKEGYSHFIINHGKREYCDKGIHVNHCESLFSLLRLFLSVHRGISKDNTSEYVRLFLFHREIINLGVEEALKRIFKCFLQDFLLYKSVVGKAGM
jgi:transposase-like protein